MKKTNKCLKLAKEITSYFKDGITVDTHAKRYIDSCFPNISFRELVDRIRREPDFDDAPLLELIFFPDEALQVRLEPFLETDTFTPEDEEEITGFLHDNNVQTTLRESETDTIVTIEMPMQILAPFVQRLKISRQIPQVLIDTIHKNIPATESTRLKVALRNARFDFSKEVIEFLDCFFKRTNPSAEYFRDSLGLVLTILDEWNSESSPYLLLKTKQEVFIRAKQAAVQFLQQLQRNNMETLMHLGIRAPEISIEEAERKIELLELIIAATEPT